jgi:hypothetical protein
LRPNSFPSRPRGPIWTSRRPTRSGQSRLRRRFPPSMRAFAFPLRRVELGEIGLAYFSPPQCEVVHRCAKFFESRAEEGKRNGNNRASGRGGFSLGSLASVALWNAQDLPIALSQPVRALQGGSRRADQDCCAGSKCGEKDFFGVMAGTPPPPRQKLARPHPRARTNDLSSFRTRFARRAAARVASQEFGT